MGEDFKDFEMEAPSLTLEPDLGELEPEVSEPQVQVQTKPEQPVLTPAEQRHFLRHCCHNRFYLDSDYFRANTRF